MSYFFKTPPPRAREWPSKIITYGGRATSRDTFAMNGKNVLEITVSYTLSNKVNA